MFHGVGHVYVYSVKSGEWKKTATLDSNLNSSMASPHATVCVDDTIYWPPRTIKDDEKSIVELNLVSGQMKKNAVTNLLIGYSEVYMYRIKGCLSLCCMKYVNGDYNRPFYDIWRLKKHDDDWGSWEKIFSLNIKGMMRLLWLHETGKCLVLYKEGQLMLHDPSQHEKDIDDFDTQENEQESEEEESPLAYAQVVGEYAESLMSPYGILYDYDSLLSRE